MKRIKLIIGILWLLFLLYFLSGCSANYHAKRAVHHIQKAKEKGLDISSDTTYIKEIITIPGDTVKVRIDSIVTDTVTVRQGVATIKYYPTPSGLGVECYCDDVDTVIFKPVIKETIPYQVRKPLSGWQKIIQTLGYIFLGALLLFGFIQVRKLLI